VKYAIERWRSPRRRTDKPLSHTEAVDVLRKGSDIQVLAVYGQGEEKPAGRPIPGLEAAVGHAPAEGRIDPRLYPVMVQFPAGVQYGTGLNHTAREAMAQADVLRKAARAALDAYPDENEVIAGEMDEASDGA
jgi:hypothetical protein